MSSQSLSDRQRHICSQIVYVIISSYTHLSTSRQTQTIKYDMRVPIDVMSTSCSRLNMDDNMPGIKIIYRLNLRNTWYAVRLFTSTDSAYHCGYDWRLGIFVNHRQEFEQQTVAGHGVQDSRYWKQTS